MLTRPERKPNPANVGGHATNEVQSTSKRTAVFLDAYGLLEPSCTWEFTRTSQDEIRGAQRLSAVLRSPRDTAISGSVELSATLTRRRFGLVSFRTALDNGTPITFSVG